jgi:hypothetical protein
VHYHEPFGKDLKLASHFHPSIWKPGLRKKHCKKHHLGLVNNFDRQKWVEGKNYAWDIRIYLCFTREIKQKGIIVRILHLLKNQPDAQAFYKFLG